MIAHLELRRYLTEQRFNIDTETISLYIAKGADPNTKNDYGETILHLAVYTRNITIVREVLKLGVDVHATNAQRETALANIMNRPPFDFEMAFVLLQEGKASPATTSLQEDNLLHLALHSGNLAYIYLALKSGVSLFNPNCAQDSPFKLMLKQKPLNLEACLLLTLAGSFAKVANTRESPLHFIPLTQTQSPQASWQSKGVTYQLDRRMLKYFARTGKNKEAVLSFIDSLPYDLKRPLIAQSRGLSMPTPLYEFFGYKRGLARTTPSSGSFLTLRLMEQKLPQRTTGKKVIHPFFGPITTLPPLPVPSAPPADFEIIKQSSMPALPSAPPPPFHEADLSDSSFFSTSAPQPGWISGYKG